MFEHFNRVEISILMIFMLNINIRVFFFIINKFKQLNNKYEFIKIEKKVKV